MVMRMHVAGRWRVLVDQLLVVHHGIGRLGHGTQCQQRTRPMNGGVEWTQRGWTDSGRRCCQHFVMCSTVHQVVPDAVHVSLGQCHVAPGTGETLDVVHVLVAHTHDQFRSVDALAATATSSHGEHSASTRWDISSHHNADHGHKSWNNRITSGHSAQLQHSHRP